MINKKLEMACRCLRVLAHPTRLLIIQALISGEKAVQEIEKEVGASQSSVSQHLTLLRDKEIISARRAGPQVFYRLQDPKLSQLLALARELFCKE